MLLTAQYIVPITAQPLTNAAVLVRDGRIRDIGDAELLKLRYPDEEVRDYGMAAIIPGLIDLYSHIESTVMRGMLPDQPYATWIQRVHEMEAKLDARDWYSSAVLGGLGELSAGITCMGAISRTGASCSAMAKLGLRGIVFRKVDARDGRRVDDAMRMARNDIARWSELVDLDRVSVGIATGETYDCHPEIFTQAAEAAREEGMPLLLTVAASREEYDFIRYGSSTLSLASTTNKRGYVEIPPWLPTGVSPVRYVLNWGAFEADNVIAVHCVHVDNEDIRKLQEYDVAIAVCPRYNAQLSMGIAPVADFLRSGLRVGLGTSYAVSTNAADILKETRIGLLLNRAENPGRFIETSTMLRMATIDAARALRMEDKIGSIEIGKYADLAVIDFSDSNQTPTDDPVSAIVNSCSGGDVLMTMVDGVIRYERNQWHVGADVAHDIARVIEVRTKLMK